MIRPMIRNAVFSAILAAGATLVVPAGAALADVTVKEKTTYYYVSGKDGAQVIRSMSRGGFWNIRQAHAIAATQTSIDFGRPQVVARNGSCRLQNPDVTLDIKYIYPKWPGYKRASPAMKKQWDRFYKELVVHEQHHGKIARKGADELDRALRNARIMDKNGCADFSVAITKKLEAILKNTEQQQVAFDKREYQNTSRVTKEQMLLFKTK